MLPVPPCVLPVRVRRYPSGLGALLVRESAAKMLRKGYFGGGTVLAALAGAPFRRFRPETHRRLADGTEDFLGILSLEVRCSADHPAAPRGGLPCLDAATDDLLDVAGAVDVMRAATGAVIHW